MSDELKNEEVIEEVDAAAAEEPAGAETQPEEPKQQEQPKKYTDADVDRIIAKKIAAERKRMTKLFNEEQQENEIEIRERNVLKRELAADAKDALIKEGLPYTLASLLNYDSKEDYECSYKEVTSIFREAIGLGIRDALKGDMPRTGRPWSGDDGIRNAFAPKAR